MHREKVSGMDIREEGTGVHNISEVNIGSENIGTENLVIENAGVENFYVENAIGKVISSKPILR